MEIKVYATLRQIVGAAAVEVSQTENDTLKTLLVRLVDIHPDLGPEIFNGEGQLHNHVHVIVNGRNVRFLAGLDTLVQASDRLQIFPPVGGGSSKTDPSTDEPVGDTAEDLTRVTLKFTSHGRKRIGRDRIEFAFTGHTLGTLLNEFFAHHDMRDFYLDEQGGLRPWARIVVNGRFSYLIGDMEAPIKDGDLIVLIHQYATAF